MESKVIKVEGMGCKKCSSKIEATFNDTEGIKSANVDLETGQVTVSYDAGIISCDEMCAIIEDLGYDAMLV